MLLLRTRAAHLRTLAKPFSSGVSSVRPSMVDDAEESTSSVHRGTAFEHRAMNMLRYLSMSLSRVGGRNDGGIDLQGWWWLPSARASGSADSGSPTAETAGAMTDPYGIKRRRIRVVAQCKAERKKLGPNYVREMEGVLHRHLPLVPQAEPFENTVSAVAVLISESAFTKAAVICAISSRLPFFLLHLPALPNTRPAQPPGSSALLDENSSNFASAIWNAPLGGQKGVLGGDIDLRWEWSNKGADYRRPSLWWRGKRLESWVPPSLSNSDGNGGLGMSCQAALADWPT